MVQAALLHASVLSPQQQRRRLLGRAAGVRAGVAGVRRADLPHKVAHGVAVRARVPRPVADADQLPVHHNGARAPGVDPHTVPGAPRSAWDAQRARGHPGPARQPPRTGCAGTCSARPTRAAARGRPRSARTPAAAQSPGRAGRRSRARCRAPAAAFGLWKAGTTWIAWATAAVSHCRCRVPSNYTPRALWQVTKLNHCSGSGYSFRAHSWNRLPSHSRSPSAVTAARA